MNFLKKKGYEGVLCMPAEYTDEPKVVEYAKLDLAYLKGLVE